MSEPYQYQSPPPSAPPCSPILHLICSILLLVLCCNIVAVGGLVFAILSKSDLDAGRIESAVKNSKIAMWFNIACLALSVIGTVLYVIFVVMIAAAGGM